jgi:diguanylate cyclase (GGDEF)-like protein/PAS domain S-box-containing protein
VATAAAVRDAGRDADRERDALAERAVGVLATEVRAAKNAVDDLRAFFESSSEVTGADFRRFTSAVLEREPSLAGLAWSEGDAGDPPAPVLAAGVVPGAPLAGPEVAGLLAAARDRGETLLSPPLGPDAATAVMVAPVYAPGARPVTPALRRAALRGFVSATVSVDALGRGAGAGLPGGVAVRVADAGPATGTLAAPGIDVAGRRLVVALDGTGGPSRLVPVAVALGGLLLAGVVALLFLESAARERSAKGELARLRVRHDLILSSAGDGIVSAGPDGRAGFVNPAAARMLGRSADDLTGAPLALTGLPSPEEALRGSRPESGETEIVRPDGSSFPAEFTTTPIVEGGGAAGAVITFRDISARKRLEARTLESLAAAEEMAAVDPLTGLANHRTFHERLNAEVDRARRSGRGVALVLMDLDHFKRVNDHHGHQTGDQVLAHAARVFRDETRSGELIARVGGEEFAMILPDADGEEALRAAERVRRAVAATEFPAVGRMTISAGVCDLGQAEDADALYRLADGALYWAKHRGRDRVVRYSPDAAEPLSAREQADRLERQQALVSVRLLARVVDAKDPSTRRHSERVGDLCAEIAEELGWSTERAAMLREAGLVHDVGKIGVPDAVLFAPRALGEDEWALVRDHAALGARIVSEALNPEQVAWVRGHHERWDGTGYPDGLLAEDCPEGARILALADAWDVMTSERPYSTTRATSADALAECRACAGGQFWPPAVEALARVRGGA